MENVKVEFTDTSKECILMMTKLSKKALRKGGKIVTKVLKDKIPVKTGRLKKSIVAKAEIDKKTGQPYINVGYRSKAEMKKKGVKFFANPTWFEFGTKAHLVMTKQIKEGNKATYKLSDGKEDFGYVVQHPGMRNKNFLRTTVYDNIEEIHQAVQEGLRELEDYVITKGMNIDLGGDEEIE